MSLLMKDGGPLYVLFGGMVAVYTDIDSKPGHSLSTLAVAGTVLTVQGNPAAVAAKLLEEALNESRLAVGPRR